MAQELTFNISEDRRKLQGPVEAKNFNLKFGTDDVAITNGNPKQWVQGRIGDNELKQVFVNITEGENNTPKDVAGLFLAFVGIIHDKDGRPHRVVDYKHSTTIDVEHGRFRFDFPDQAFTVAGEYQQAFFMLVKEGPGGGCVATMEFDMQVMANFVFTDLVPEDYITPFNDTVDQLLAACKKFKDDTAADEAKFKQELEDTYAKFQKDTNTQFNNFKDATDEDLANFKKANADDIAKFKQQYANAVQAKEDELQNKVDSYTDKLDTLLKDLNQQGIDTTTLLTTLQANIKALEAKIKQDDLVTKGEFAKLQQSLEAELQQEETKLHGVVDQVADSVNHQFKYLSMGINIADGVDGQTLFNDEYSACQNNLMDFTLIDRVDVPSATATTFTPTSDAVMKSAIDKLHQNGRKILMLKPHLFVGGREIYRENYKPTDITAFFTNWQTFLEREAKICTENDIPVLCIEVEMNTVFSDANFDRIKTLISNLKQKYPDLKLTAGCNKFFVEGFMKILSLVDIIGINVYPSYASSIPTNVAQMSVPELVPKAAEFMFNSDRLAQKIDDTVLEFHKPIIITEIGIYPFKEGLIQPLLSMDTQDVIDGKVVPDFNVTALAMRAAIEGLAYVDSVIGVSWFASGVPMFFKDYYREDAAVPNAAERAWNELSKAYYWEGR